MRHFPLFVALTLIAGSLCGIGSTIAAEDKAAEIKIEDYACPVSGKAADQGKFAEFDGGKVYFCCSECQAKFEKEKATFAAKAHLQMVQTGQFVQKACPFSGGKTKAGTEVAVDGVKVAFCCDECKAKAQKAGDDAVKLVFGAGFAKGFVKK